jgi:hypothetical protein
MIQFVFEIKKLKTITYFVWFLLTIPLSSCSFDRKGNDFEVNTSTSYASGILTCTDNNFNDTSSQNKESHWKIEGDSALLPSFNVAINLSPSAKEQFEKERETIIVDFYICTERENLSNGKALHRDEDGLYYLIMTCQEINYDQIAKFDKLKISKKTYDLLIDKNISGRVAVMSGNHSKDKIHLNTDSYWPDISNLVNRTFVFDVKLADE